MKAIKPEPPLKKRKPGPEAKVDFEEVKKILEETRSVTVTSTILGVSQPYLSHYLNRKCRKAWWLSKKKNWKLERDRARARAKRQRAYERSKAHVNL